MLYKYCQIEHSKLYESILQFQNLSTTSQQTAKFSILCVVAFVILCCANDTCVVFSREKLASESYA